VALSFCIQDFCTECPVLPRISFGPTIDP
jgi:hypothetical protein